MGRFFFSKRWALIKRADLDELQSTIGRLRERTEASAIEVLERDAYIDMLKTQLADVRSTLGQCDALRLETMRRAEVAETIARSQAVHIEQLQKSNDTALQSIVDMRRIGFAMPFELKEHDGEPLSSVGDDDRAMLRERPEFIAPDD